MQLKKILAALLVALPALAETKVRNSITQGASVQVLDKGASTGSTDNAVAIQAAIDSASGCVAFPVGIFISGALMLRDGTCLVGQGIGKTILQAKAGTANLFVLPTGRVRYLKIWDMSLTGDNTTTTQGGFYFQAQASSVSPFDGGIWYSTFKNLYFSNFKGVPVWFRGGTSAFLLPHQFVTFENVTIIHPDGSNIGLKLTGQIDQFDFNLTEVDQTYGNPRAGTGVYIGADTVGTNIPTNITFHGGSTFQYHDVAIEVSSARSVTVRESWLEQNNRSINVHIAGGVSAAQSVHVYNNHFANSCSDGAAGGYCMQADATAQGLDFRDNEIVGTYDNILKSVNGGMIAASGNRTINNDFPTSNVDYQVTPAATLNLGTARSVFLNNSATAITTIASNLAPGESIVFTVSAGGTAQFGTGGNIRLDPMLSPFTLGGNEMATFTRTDLSTNWRLTSYSGAQGREGYVHKRVRGALNGVSGCATAASAGATCNTTITFGTAFLDSNHAPVCQGEGITSGVPLVGAITSKAAGSFVFTTVAGTAAAAQFTTINCIIEHD